MWLTKSSNRGQADETSAAGRRELPWQDALDAVESNMMFADKELNIRYANPATLRTLERLAGPLQEAFGVDVREVLGGSIHRFHKDPARIERILDDPAALPHEAEFTFAGITLSAKVNRLNDADGELFGYIVNWEDVTERIEREKRASKLVNMIENLPLNVIFADKDLVVQYMNPASKKTLESLKHLLPVPVDSIVGNSIDAFHKDPSHQRQLLSDPNNLPIHTQIHLGDETLDLLVSAIYDNNDDYVGAMATWSVITEQVRTKQHASEIGRTVASTSTQMAAAIGEISQSVSHVATMASQAEQLSEKTTLSIDGLSESSEHIGSVVAMIRELADQTNLLALNATIEAARAGESGRSFAVVAGEVKELAKGTTEATQSISERVGTIQSSIKDVVESSAKIADTIADVSRNTTTIAAAVEEQSVAMNDLSTSADGLTALAT